MTKKRQEILEPLTRELLGRVDNIIGKRKPSAEPAPYKSPKTKHLIKSQIIPCKSCHKPAAMLIFAPDATTAAELEDYARLMYDPMQKTKVPTWILGDEYDVNINGQQDIKIFFNENLSES
ncbi:MAG: hypothetical protein LRY69_05870 [Gammaproteobacteria bacterium]|nr:hypothetical protein [Gammaproteobacteria bacterium]